jgi:uncharacterized protein (TIGR02271 family)
MAMTATNEERQAQKLNAGPAHRARPASNAKPAGKTRPGEKDEWVDCQEERLQVDKETIESGHVRLHRYVDTEPVEATVHLSHEEFDVETVPAKAGEPVRGTLSETEKEITLHAERPVAHKDVVSVARVRLVTKNVEEDLAIHDEVRRERIEVEQDAQAMSAGGPHKSRPRK